MARRAIVAAVLAAVVTAAAGSAAGRSRSAQRPAATLAAARQSSNLWATVNICDTRRHPHTIGIRGQMPALSSGSAMVMIIRVEYWSPSSGRFERDPGVKRQIRLGTYSWGLHQGGWNFRFAAHAGLLRGIVTFEWNRSGKVVRRATRVTTGGHHHADFGEPRGYSAGTCRIK